MKAVLPVYRRSKIRIARGEGCYLFAEDGARYLDFAAGIAVNALGHCHPAVVSALKKQAEILWHCSNMYETAGLSQFAEKLTNACFADKIFFTNSGGEAVETGLKILRKYHYARGNPEKYRVITMTGGFHGRSFACISAGGNEVARAGYAPLLDGFDRVEFNNLAAVKAAITRETAAILVEPIQGEGGINEATPEFLQGLRSLADAHGLLLFIDEVQCGMGRVGSLFAYENAGITPDIVATAKGIGNGFPLGACLMTDNVAACMNTGAHGSTYGANPLAMAVGNAVLDEMLAPIFLSNVEKIGKLLKEKLQELAKDFPKIKAQVRGRGLILGLKINCHPREGGDLKDSRLRGNDNVSLVEKLRENGLLVSPAEDNIIRITPPLIIDENHVDEAIKIMRKTFEEVI
jgi:acetylornithine/N-succinyldiaminopimelate aminotransferase